MTQSRPNLGDLYRLAAQLEQDREQPVAALRERDRAVAAEQADAAALPRLLHWLDTVSPAVATTVLQPLSEASAALLARLLALLAGFAAMAGFLLGSERALVNVFLFLALFVLLQFLLSLLAAVMMWRTVRGHVPMALPLHPGRWIVQRSLPDRRTLREAQPVLRMLFLRYGQELGALFTLGAALAFLLVPALGEFSFVWGSTFNPGAGLVQRLTETLALPWSAWLPLATVPSEVVANSRFHPATVALNRSDIESMRGWWPFLWACLLVYALLPRLLLWVLSRLFSRRLLARSFLHYPGAEQVLARMQAPLVRTRATEATGAPAALELEPAPLGIAATDASLLLLDYGGALGPGGPADFEELMTVPPGQVLVVGAAALQDDLARLAELPVAASERLLLVVKAWEPPLGELRDLLKPLAAVPRCTVLLAPLPGRAIPHRKVEDWRSFARSLPFASVDVQLLNRVQR
ncbi:DUF2868 domain-containing protein [Haliea sp. E1-2-M8]|uniref:DUF2868 domain-containing protein n=1 Tax=Haliea sp. E1-2-M8 TaxID=3064706 RepID=UPI0027218BBA|nr:DUF2868 domain-containing protein [Haliea sp. E1-2-M8]MDO8860854.1 DUF2868 domain-containing protein [Haliea sp. E1-2-M8]